MTTEIKDLTGCVNDVPNGKECATCSDYYDKSGDVYCMVIENLNSGLHVMRCQDCQKFRTMTDDEKSNINNDTHEVHCDCGTTWNMEDMRCKL